MTEIICNDAASLDTFSNESPLALDSLFNCPLHCIFLVMHHIAVFSQAQNKGEVVHLRTVVHPCTHYPQDSTFSQTATYSILFVDYFLTLTPSRTGSSRRAHAVWE